MTENPEEKSSRPDVQVRTSGQAAPLTYANIARLQHSAHEFILDFGIRMPEDPDSAQLVARILLSPPHCKALLYAMFENIRKYEERHGKISGVSEVDWMIKDVFDDPSKEKPAAEE